MVDNALTTGVVPERIIENMYMGNVCIEAPEQKNEIIKSSSEIINTKSPEAKSAGDDKRNYDTPIRLRARCS